ncbi:conserved hypothetical protein [Ricinus communis]|uniref:Uncharacterized protein n=1 Tax=Ricinus communis TaxID=3988 RepID=B9RVM2_RICCO|nr:conserved hypothetical protein [Ricinus communis]
MSSDRNPAFTHVVASATNVVNNNSSFAAVQLIPPMPYSKPFPDISKVEVFSGQNYRRW